MNSFRQRYGLTTILCLLSLTNIIVTIITDLDYLVATFLFGISLSIIMIIFIFKKVSFIEGIIHASLIIVATLGFIITAVVGGDKFYEGLVAGIAFSGFAYSLILPFNLLYFVIKNLKEDQRYNQIVSIVYTTFLILAVGFLSIVSFMATTSGLQTV